MELSLLDALYLVEKGKLEVEDASGSKVSPETLRQLGRETYENFDEVYAVYRDLRDKGLVVKSGMKFGATFVVYRLGPGLEHAPFLVHVLPYNMPTYLPAMGLSLDTLATVALSARSTRYRFRDLSLSPPECRATAQVASACS